MGGMMELHKTPIEGLKVATTNIRGDNRGSFGRLFCREELAISVGERQICQINYSSSKAKGTIRGMHYQTAPFAEMKLVRCLKGSVLDVAVDLRKGSPTFLKWHAVELSSENFKMMVIEEGFAHGFQTLTDDCELLYLHTAPYNSNHEGGVLYNDPAIGISWPLAVAEISTRDLNHPIIPNDFKGLSI